MPKVMGLFAGCGGLDLGFQDAGFEIAYANDKEKSVKLTYEFNLKHEIHIEDFCKVDKKITTSRCGSCWCSLPTIFQRR